MKRTLMFGMQITIVQPGGFDTGGAAKTAWAASHPAYDNDTLPVAAFRKSWASYNPTGDARKAMEALYKLTLQEKLPPRFALGKGTIAAIKSKATALAANAEEYESWSENLEKAA